MNKYQTIKSNLELGHFVVMKNENGYYQVISPFKDLYGNYRYSGRYFSIEVAKQMIGSYPGYSNLEEESKYWEIVEVYIPVPERKLEVGEEVQVASNAKEWCEYMDWGWDEEKEKMVGKTFKIKVLGGNYVNLDNNYNFPLQAVHYPIIEEETITKDEAEKLLGKKII